MAEEITISVDDRAVRKFLEKAPRLMRKVQRSAVAKTTKFVQSQVAKEVGRPQGILNAPQKTVKKVIRIKTRPTASNPTGEVEITGKAIRLAEFGARKTKKGVTAKEFKASPRKLFKDAFIIKVGPFTGVFKREHKRGEGRQFRQMWGPAVSDVFDFSPATERRILDKSNEKLRRETLSQISRFLDVKADIVREAFE